MIKFFLFISLLISLVSCGSKNKDKKNVCFLLYDMKTKNFNVVQGVRACGERLPAASTFKIPLAVMAFDTRILKDVKSEFKWDGTKHPIESWNKNHTAESWMKDSVVWYSQKITSILREKKLKMYLDSFKYGNADLSGGLKYAWLTPAPFVKEPIQNSLKISAYEQISFLEKLWRGELKAAKRAQSLTRGLLAQDQSPKGYVLRGKTGSGFLNDELTKRVGWFVGHYKTREAEFLVVTNFVDRQEGEPAFAGREAKELTIKYLKENHLW